MDYEKKYPITQQPGDYLFIQWERGYKYVEVFYRDRLVGSVSGAAKLRKGVRLQDETLGNIDLKLSEKPVVLDVVVDGYHSPVNQSHPKKELKRIAAFFWIISALSVIAGLLEVGNLSGYGGLQAIWLIIVLTIITVYILSAVFVSQGKSWAFYMGFSLFSLLFLFHLLVLFLGASILDMVFEVFRIAGLVILILNMKTAIAAARHDRFGKQVNDDLLDA